MASPVMWQCIMWRDATYDTPCRNKRCTVDRSATHGNVVCDGSTSTQPCMSSLYLSLSLSLSLPLSFSLSLSLSLALSLSLSVYLSDRDEAKRVIEAGTSRLAPRRYLHAWWFLFSLCIYV